MSELRKTPVNKQWMPNLMFDSETNDFAIQNLLEKEGPQFVAGSERRAAAAFVVDRLGQEEEAPSKHKFVADNASDEDEEENLAEALQAHAHDHAEQEPVVATLKEEEIQLAAAAEAEAAARAEAEAQAAEQAAALAAEQAAEQAAQAAALAAVAEENVVEQEEVELITAEEQTPDLSNEAVTSLVEAAREEARAIALAEGHQQGFDIGYAQALTELKAEMDAKVAALQSMCDGIRELSTDADALFDPVKKLAVHLAEQLVRGELTQSGQVISRIVENCVREMSGSSEKTLIVHLNPDDLELYKPLAEQFGATISLRPNSTLQRGSVRVSLDGAVVEDLIERRVQALSKSLKEAAPTGWRNNASTNAAAGNSLAARMENRQQEVETVAVTNTANTPANENNPAGEPSTGLDHD